MILPEKATRSKRHAHRLAPRSPEHTRPCPRWRDRSWSRKPAGQLKLPTGMAGGQLFDDFQRIERHEETRGIFRP